jgi:hypothetical protein
MHEHHSSEPAFSSREDERKVEDQILRLLLEEHPAQVTRSEIEVALNCGSQTFAERDAIERALLELVGHGLLHRHGDFFLPSRPSRYMASLVIG